MATRKKKFLKKVKGISDGLSYSTSQISKEARRNTIPHPPI